MNTTDTRAGQTKPAALSRPPVAIEFALERIQQGERRAVLEWAAGELLDGLREMARRFYAGDVRAVDEFCRRFGLGADQPRGDA